MKPKSSITTVIVAGATGYIGRVLVNHLRARGYDVRPISLRQPHLAANLRAILTDLERDCLALVVLSWDWRSPSTNVSQLAGLLQVADQQSLRNLIYVSTEAPREESAQQYAQAKWRCERLVLDHNHRVLRFGYIFGGVGKRWNDMKSLSRLRFAPLPCGDVIIRPQHIYDAAAAIEACLSGSASVTAVESGLAVSFADFAFLLRGYGTSSFYIPTSLFQRCSGALRAVQKIAPIQTILGLVNLAQRRVARDEVAISGRATEKFFRRRIGSIIRTALSCASTAPERNSIPFAKEEFEDAQLLMSTGIQRELLVDMISLNGESTGTSRPAIGQRVQTFASNLVLLFCAFG